MKIRILMLLSLVALASASIAQKKMERPKLHADFYFGTYPAAREADTLMAKEGARLILVGLHQGWDVEKIAKEGKQKEEDLDNLFADMEDARLIAEVDQFSSGPLLPVIRDKDIEKIQKSLDTHTRDLTREVQSLLPEVEKTLSSFTDSKNVPKPQLLYQVLIGSILFGGMQEMLVQDQTMMVNPPRRANGLRYYAWLVEGDPALAGKLKRDQWESGGYTMVSIGKTLPQERLTIDRLRAANGMILEEADAKKYRSFLAVFTRDKLLPYFKKNRADYLKALNVLEAGKYVRVADAFAWYYDQLANGVATELTAAKVIQPADQYVFAYKAPAR